ncbi:MAG: 4Fe-4S binding protein [Promethearchaeota archaeon]
MESKEPTPSSGGIPIRTMDIDESNAMVNKWEFEGHQKVLKFHMEKCIGCDLCRLICPTTCITLGPVAEIASGQLEMVPPINIDFDACAYCGLCSAICPTNALEFSTEPADFIENDDLPVFSHKQFIARVQDGMNRSLDRPWSSSFSQDGLEKPNEGEVLLRHDLIDKCDPMGCKGCLNICPTDCFWVPKRAEDILNRGKITLDEDLCIHCGACKNACPEKIIEVTRSAVDYSIPSVNDGKFWRQGWQNTISRLFHPELLDTFETPIPILEEEAEKVAEIIDEAILELPESVRRDLEEKYEKVKDALKKINVRFWIELKKMDKLKASLEKIF